MDKCVYRSARYVIQYRHLKSNNVLNSFWNNSQGEDFECTEEGLELVIKEVKYMRSCFKADEIEFRVLRQISEDVEIPT